MKKFSAKKTVEELDTYELLDTLPEEEYDEMTLVASQICGTPISLVSLLDIQKQFFKSNRGMDVTETPIEYAFCSHAVLNPNQILVVEDARIDPRFKDNPLVVSDPHIVFYAGVPLVSPKGIALGTLCVIDKEKKKLSKDQINALFAIANQVMRLFELRKKDIERRKIEIQNQLQNDIITIFSKDLKLNETLVEVLKHLSNLDNNSFSEIWLTNSRQDHLQLVFKNYRDKNGKLFYENSLELSKLNKGEGLPGSVWQKNHLEIWGNLATHPNFVRSNASKVSNIKTVIGIPLIHIKHFVGVIVIGSTKLKSKLKRNLEIYRTLQSFLGAEIKRKQQEEEMKLLFESSPDILAIATPNGYFTKVNPAFCEILGYTAEYITSKSIFNFIHPEDVLATQIEFNETKTGERLAKNFVNRYITKSGSIKWISWSSSDKFGEDNTLFAHGRDVTEMHRLRNLLDSASQLAKVGSWEIDVIKGTVFWSDITKTIREAETDFEPTLEQGISGFVEGYDRDTIRQCVEDCIEKGIEWDKELRIITNKGNLKWIRTIGRPEFVKGKCVRVYGSFQDIHKRKMVELELLKFKKVIENSKDGIAIASAKGEALYMNPSFSESLGYSSEALELKGGPSSVYADQNIAEELFSNLLSGNYWKGDIDLLDVNNNRIHYYLSGGPIFDEHNKQVAIFGIHTNITERKNYEIFIEEQNKKLKEIAWKQSHVVRAPIARIMGIIDMLQNNMLTKEEEKVFLDGLSKSAGEIDLIIKDIVKKSSTIID